MIALANTLWASGDDLSSPAGLGSWLRAVQEGLGVELPSGELRVDEREWRAAVELRAVVRELAAGGRPDLAALNAVVRAAPRWRELGWEGGEPVVAVCSAGGAVAAALAGVAEAAVVLFSGPDRGLVQACGAPSCIRFFVREHPRREWCSPGCGNRVRVARHYARAKGR
ncbi:CGNR zinc finger domain-containing protein [Nonomuraea sp. NBC_01738]|uniref:CGNR zinc finger domain-containing protein n=1 Tax=Nonomuraea sp. NBC_01738 TaxID=2976003 RepID=UPI002E0F3F3C|nr:CGNR zinc finger domain-containing protein [Nonomuraea sp. NBC_01738]